MLAKIANDTAGLQEKRGDFKFFASKLAPTVLCTYADSAIILLKLTSQAGFLQPL
ncbi:hypothetical protein VO64_5175 [Pseudomonas synxantha]|uniref:Uncharacterized protein n=1 Tax=Pseudomonas synxantha TaxID=47883 RepID=A0AAU8TYB1_9PSED|nr:hypothetical protein VO64_5175 [Pseudomonas synxantha]